MAQFSEPGVIRKIVQNAGIDAIIGDEAFASPERDDVSRTAGPRQSDGSSLFASPWTDEVLRAATLGRYYDV